MMKNGKEPSEVDAPFVWVNIKEKNEKRMRESMRGNSPRVITAPPNWKITAFLVLIMGAKLFAFFN